MYCLWLGALAIAAHFAFVRGLSGTPHRPLWRPGHSRVEVPAPELSELTLEERSSYEHTAGLPVVSVYGVNLGNWLIFEPWMAPEEWQSMGGEICGGTCSSCIMSEWALAKSLGQTATNAAFQSHWESWLTESDVAQIAAANLNTVRIPMGFWIIEDLLNGGEPYAQGGLDELIRGLKLFTQYGIHVVLDQHALPGVAAVQQMFAGNCTSDPLFYNHSGDYNYRRAVTWGVVMAWLSHSHTAFEKVFALEAINEPIQNKQQTPGLYKYERAYVKGLRSLEYAMGLSCGSSTVDKTLTDAIAQPAFVAALPIIAKLATTYKIGSYKTFKASSVINAKGAITKGSMSSFLNSDRTTKCLSSMFMTRDWQYDNPSNPAKWADGVQIYDDHVYFNYGGVSPNQTELSYMDTLCHIGSVAHNKAIGDIPLIFGEWSLATSFTPSSGFMDQWADAQKVQYNKGAGWIFWNWKVNIPDDAQQQLQWSYQSALAAGIFTSSPTTYHDSNVCTTYFESSAVKKVKGGSSSSASTSTSTSTAIKSSSASSKVLSSTTKQATSSTSALRSSSQVSTSSKKLSTAATATATSTGKAARSFWKRHMSRRNFLGANH